MHDGDSDLVSIRNLIGTEAEEFAKSLDAPEKVIEQVGRCRIVITGSYHAGVFALSQGVSVIGVAGSDYYRHKFEGLAGQFPGGCYIVDRDRPNFEQNLRNTIEKAWQDADGNRPALLKRAEEQIKVAEAAYDEFANIINNRLNLS